MRGAVHAFSQLGQAVHLRHPLFRGQPQLIDQKRQVDTELLSRLDAASRSRMAQSLRGPLKFFRRQRSKFPHNSSLPPARDIMDLT